MIKMKMSLTAHFLCKKNLNLQKIKKPVKYIDTALY